MPIPPFSSPPAAIRTIPGLPATAGSVLPFPTLSAAGTPTLTTNYLGWDRTNSRPFEEYFAYSRTVLQAGSSVADRDSARGFRADSSSVGSGTIGDMRVSFFLYAQAFEVKFKYQTNTLRVNITNYSDESPAKKVAFDSQYASSQYGIGWSGLNSGSFYYLKFDYGSSVGRQLMKVDLQMEGYFAGINLPSAVDMVFPGITEDGPMRLGTETKPDLFVVGDSFSEAANSGPNYGAFGNVMGTVLGWNPIILGAGGTGYLNNNKMRYLDRIAPRTNGAWVMANTLAGSGNFTITYNSLTTANIAFSSTVSTQLNSINSALNTTFGTNSYGWQNVRMNWTEEGWILTTETGTGTPTVTPGGGVTGTFVVSSSYLGDIDANVRRDPSGNAMPFVLFIEGGFNDDGFSSANATAAANACWLAAKARWPTATLVVAGPSPTKTGLDSTKRTLDAAFWTQAKLTLPKINGFVPYISGYVGTYTEAGYRIVDWSSGLGYVGNALGTGPNDWFTSDDSIHPTAAGQQVLGLRFVSVLSKWFRYGRPPLLPQSQTLSVTTGIDGKSVANTAVYSVPAGKSCVVTAAVIRCTAASAITVGPSVGVGSAAGTSNIFSSTALAALIDTTGVFGFQLIGMSVIVAASGTVYLNLGTAATGTSQSLAIDLIGYLV